MGFDTAIGDAVTSGLTYAAGLIGDVAPVLGVVVGVVLVPVLVGAIMKFTK